ncbi:MAG: hypothetical protein WCO60_18605 [Verrucomicrobiota bacterium]
MIRNHQSETHSTKSSASKNSVGCWMESQRHHAVRFELDDQRFFIFPFTYFIVAEFSTSDGTDELKLTFSSYEIRINGRDLRELAIGFQKQTVEWVKVIPATYAALVPTGAPLVLSITVKALTEDEQPHENE